MGGSPARQRPFCNFLPAAAVRVNLTKRGMAVRMNRRAPLPDLDSSSQPPFKTRKDLKHIRFSKNERPKRFAGTGK